MPPPLRLRWARPVLIHKLKSEFSKPTRLPFLHLRRHFLSLPGPRRQQLPAGASETTTETSKRKNTPLHRQEDRLQRWVPQFCYQAQDPPRQRL